MIDNAELELLAIIEGLEYAKMVMQSTQAVDELRFDK